MDRQEVAARCGKRADVAFRLLDHQVDIEGKLRAFPQVSDHGRPDGDVRHETAVHHVDVDPVCSGPLHGGDFFSKPAEVRGQD
jgi:hypothetical protein